MTREIKFRAWDKENMRMVSVIDFSCMNYPEQYDVMQYTCLKDKNGKEIWEGDILSQKDYVGKPLVVQWQSGHGNHGVGYWRGFNMPEHPWEIIGNIYENPELIK